MFVEGGLFFEIKDSEVYSVIGDIEKILDEADVENIDSIMEKITERVIANEDENEKVFISSSIDKLQQELYMMV